MWSICKKEENSRIFDQKSSSLHEIQDLILLRLSWWIKEWGVLSPIAQMMFFKTLNVDYETLAAIKFQPHFIIQVS